MSNEVEGKPQAIEGEDENIEGAGEEPGPASEQLSQEDREVYEQMLVTLSKMNKKIEKNKQKLGNDKFVEKKQRTDEISDKLIQSKESSEIITKENLLTDITQTYEKAVVEVYSENSKLKKKMEEMAKLIRDQNAKLIAHAQKEKDLIAENQQIRAELNKVKDQKLMLARGNPAVLAGNENRIRQTKEKLELINSKEQQDDFDFWSMPQDNYGRKKKEFVQDSNLWVNQKGSEGGLFLTEEKPTSNKKRR